MQHQYSANTTSSLSMEQGSSLLPGARGCCFALGPTLFPVKKVFTSSKEEKGRAEEESKAQFSLHCCVCCSNQQSWLAESSVPSSAAHALSRMCWAQSSPSSTLTSTRFSQKYTIQFLMSNLILRTLSSFSLER